MVIVFSNPECLFFGIVYQVLSSKILFSSYYVLMTLLRFVAIWRFDYRLHGLKFPSAVKMVVKLVISGSIIGRERLMQSLAKKPCRSEGGLFHVVGPATEKTQYNNLHLITN